jgi:hypothetical protein
VEFLALLSPGVGGSEIDAAELVRTALLTMTPAT